MLEPWPGTATQSTLRELGFEFLDGARASVHPSLRGPLADLGESFDRLPEDPYLRDGQKFRYRAYGRFLLAPGGRLQDLPTQPFFQSGEYNRYAGGIQRHLPELDPRCRRNPMLRELIRRDASHFTAAVDNPTTTWRVEVHLFRIVARPDAPGYPTPEGIHRDENDFFAIHLLKREGVRAGDGVTTIYDPQQRLLAAHTLRTPLDTLLADDRRVLHAVSPINLADRAEVGIRDVVNIDFFITDSAGVEALDSSRDQYAAAA